MLQAKTSISVALALFCTLSHAARVRAVEAPRRPNFVFILTDDQRWDAMGVVQREQGRAARFPWLKTPNMDRLASQGVRFRNAFVVNSLCSPSRASFLAGTYGHVNGVVDNHAPLPPDCVTYASLLRRAGYVTGFVGKWHMGLQHGQRPGFDFSASFIGQGEYWNCPVEIDGVQTETKGWIDDVSVDYALQFLQRNHDRPFMLSIGFKACHWPCKPPDRTRDAYRNDLAAAVPNLNATAPYLAAGKHPRSVGQPPLEYFRCLSAVDDDVGRLLDELDRLGLTDNTMVIFASDNGFYFGEHGLGDKRSAYEESLRIPLIVRFPRLKQPHRIVDQMALNIDLAPTILDFAGLPPEPQMQGTSWRPLLEGRPDGWRKDFFYAYLAEQQFAWVPQVRALRTDTSKLIEYPGHDDWTELFDLTGDPYEMNNLAANPSFALTVLLMKAEMDRQARAVGFVVPPYADKVNFRTRPASRRHPAG